MTRWLVTGGGGQLGSRLRDLLPDAAVLTSTDLDITDPAAVDAAIADLEPDVVLNAAAYTAVDAAEAEESAAHSVNSAGPANLATALARHGGRLVHVSTDYVFDGTATAPYEPDHPPAPATAYGRTKRAGELEIGRLLPARSLIVRTAWLYGGPGPNFVDTMLRLEREHDTVDVVNDQRGSPTYVMDLARALVSAGHRTDMTGVVHYANAGVASWFDLARETFRLAGADPSRVRASTSDAFIRAAARPAWSVLSARAWERAGLPAPRTWQAALAEHVSRVGGEPRR